MLLTNFLKAVSQFIGIFIKLPGVENVLYSYIFINDINYIKTFKG